VWIGNEKELPGEGGKGREGKGREGKGARSVQAGSVVTMINVFYDLCFYTNMQQRGIVSGIVSGLLSGIVSSISRDISGTV